jgi:FKBP-type peptidyl-prolyl cis-trans isomerase
MCNRIIDAARQEMMMTRKWIPVLSFLLLAVFTQASAQDTQVPKTEKEKLSYSLGVEMVVNLKRQKTEIDVDTLVRGIKDALSGEKLLMSDHDIRASIDLFQVELKQKQIQARKTATGNTQQAAEDNRKAGEAFLAENRTKEGVVTLPSGLQYKVLTKGDGKKPSEPDAVEVNYRGTLIDGTEFDSSFRGGKPATLKLATVIGGWKEALQLMPAGSKWQIYIPPQLAYGERGSGSQIGPNATLIFEVELLAVK